MEVERATNCCQRISANNSFTGHFSSNYTYGQPLDIQHRDSSFFVTVQLFSSREKLPAQHINLPVAYRHSPISTEPPSRAVPHNCPQCRTTTSCKSRTTSSTWSCQDTNPITNVRGRYDFEYEEDDDEETGDVDIENKYYNAKQQKLSEPGEAIDEFLGIPALESEKGEWGFKGLKQAIKLEFKLGRYTTVRDTLRATRIRRMS